MKKLILIFWLFCGLAYGADSTVTICPSGCDYTTLGAALTDNQMNIQAVLGDGFDMIFDIVGPSLDTSDPSSISYTTDNNNRGIVKTSGSARNTTGVWSASYYISQGDVAFDHRSDFFILDGLQLECNSTGGGGQGVRLLADSCVVKNCIIRQVTAGTGAYDGIQFGGDDRGAFIYNNIIYDFDNTGGDGISVGLGGAGSNHNTFIYNNTISNCTKGMNLSPIDVIAKNNIIWGCPTVASGELSTSIQSDYNATDSSAFGWTNGGANDSVDASFSFVGSGSDNWNLSSQFAGDDLSADANLAFSDDNRDVTRTVTWSAGALEFVAAAGEDIFGRRKKMMRGN